VRTGHVAGVLVQIPRDLAGKSVRAALWFESAGVAIQFAGAIESCALGCDTASGNSVGASELDKLFARRAGVTTEGAIGALKAHGSRELADAYLPPMVSGRWTGTMNLTESQAGSDLNAVRTRAERAEDGSYRLFGQKIFITYGEHDMAENIVHLVLARLPGAPAGTRGLSLFLAPKFLVNADGSLGERNDLRCSGIEHKLGIHGSPTCVMAYGDNDGAKAWLVGEENRGLNAMFVMMNAARLAVGAQGVAIADRAYQQALTYARERRQGRGSKGADGMAPIIEHPDVQRMLMTMKANVHAARGICCLTGVSINLADHARTEDERTAAANRAALLTPIAKAFSTDIGDETTSIGVQVHGGMGFIEETGAAQHMRDSRIAAIYEGANGIHAIDLVQRDCHWPAGRPSTKRSPASAQSRATSPPREARASARPPRA
jgi:acyl-CoA dehydrogenase